MCLIGKAVLVIRRFCKWPYHHGSTVGQHAFGKVPVVEKGLNKSLGWCLSNTVIEDRMPWTHVPEECSWVSLLDLLPLRWKL